MYRYGISCALEALPEQQPTILRGDIFYVIKTAAEIGYDAIELFIRDPKQYSARLLKKVADDEGLAFCGIATGMEYTRNQLSLISDEPSIRAAAIDRLKEHLELGAQIGAPVVVGIMRANVPDFNRYQEYEDRLTNALLQLSDYAKQIGASIVVESIMRYINNYLNSVPETAAYLRKIGRENIALHIDTHSMVVEDKNLVRSVHTARDILKYVHFSDSNRGYPGAGNIDFKAVMGALMDIRYEGYITTECQPYPTQYECAKRGLEYMKALESVLTIERRQEE